MVTNEEEGRAQLVENNCPRTPWLRAGTNCPVIAGMRTLLVHTVLVQRTSVGSLLISQSLVAASSEHLYYKLDRSCSLDYHQSISIKSPSSYLNCSTCPGPRILSAVSGIDRRWINISNFSPGRSLYLSISDHKKMPMPDANI